MKLIVGLGNPGKDYENTRHNVGFMLLDYLSNKYNVSISNKKFNGLYTDFIINNEKVIFLKPLSFMNLSGEVVSKFVNYFDIKLDDILVIQDDLDMDLGSYKLMYNHSAGGHNGIKDIERCLGSREFTRLKIGISNNKDMDTKDYVLGKFSNNDICNLNNSFVELKDIVDDFIYYDRDKLMNKYNRKNK